MIRLILAALVAVLYLIITIPILFLEWIIKKINKDAADISSLRMVQWIFKVILWVSGVKVSYQGLENLDNDEAVLYIGNHSSIFDVLVTYPKFKNKTGFIAKNNIEKVPLLRVWMRRLYCLFLNRENPKEGIKTILAAIDSIKNGVSIFIFPEGTRTKTGEMNPFKEGSFKVATKTDCPILPVAITNTANIWENHLPTIKATKVVVSFGKPFKPSDLEEADKKKIGAYTQNIISEMLEDNKKILETMK